MSLAGDLGYELPERNWFHRVVVVLVGTPVGGWLGYHLVPPMDRVVIKVTEGKGTITQWFAGVPPIWVSPVGARSGKKRSTPLFGIPLDGNLALIGTGFGQAPTPAWVYNLEANSDAEISFRGRTVSVSARPASPDEDDRAWDSGARIYPGFPRYRARLTERAVRVFILEPR